MMSNVYWPLAASFTCIVYCPGLLGDMFVSSLDFVVYGTGGLAWHACAM